MVIQMAYSQTVAEVADAQISMDGMPADCPMQSRTSAFRGSIPSQYLLGSMITQCSPSPQGVEPPQSSQRFNSLAKSVLS